MKKLCDRQTKTACKLNLKKQKAAKDFFAATPKTGNFFYLCLFKI